MKYGMLRVLHEIGPNKFGQPLWVCECDCGEFAILIASAVRNGHTKSCGHLKSAGNRRTHGQRAQRSKAYSAWRNMKTRCDWLKSSQWKDYGGRGIKYDPRWTKFEEFYADMGSPPEGMSLDRRDNDKGYSKSNCRWADRPTQRRNSRSHVVWVEIEGEKMILTDACRKLKIVTQKTASNRIFKGWSPADAVLTPYTRSDNKGYRA